MSIASEIQRIKNNIANAYTNCSNKGATIPSTQNCANLATCINSIPTGITPTGTLNITENGTVDVTNYAQASVNVSGGQSSKFGATIDTFLGEVDSNGVLQIPNSGKYLVFNGVKRIRESALTYRFCVYNSGTSGINNITGVSFPDLESLDSYNVLEKTFYAQDNLQEVLMPKLVSITNNNCFREAFAYCSNLSRVEIPSLVTIPQGSYGGAFYRAFFSTGLRNLDLSNLTNVAGSQTFYSAFAINPHLTNINMPNLTSVTGDSSLYGMFERCGLTTFTFEKLSTVTGYNALSYMFYDCTSLTSLYFPALTPNSFGSYTNQFSGMLNGVNGCTVHFPIKIKQTIQNWSDVTNGFRGTNTVILFDLNAATLNFSCTPNTTQIYIDRASVTNNSIDVPAEDTEFLAYDSSLNTVLSDTITNLSENEIRNISVNLNQTKQKMTISTNVSGLNVYFTIDGITFNGLEATSKNYVINYIGSTGNNIRYFVDGGNNYSDADGVITTNGNNQTQSVTLSSATISDFSRPNLSANGTIGGNSFAVSCDSSVSGYSAYYAVDGNTDYLWMVNNTNSICKYTFYNPLPLKVSQIVNYYTSTTYSAANFIIEGSNDNQNWTEIGTYTVTKTLTQTIPVNSTRFYKYHRITYKNSTIRLKDLGITATQKG